MSCFQNGSCGLIKFSLCPKPLPLSGLIGQQTVITSGDYFGRVKVRAPWNPWKCGSLIWSLGRRKVALAGLVGGQTGQIQSDPFAQLFAKKIHTHIQQTHLIPPLYLAKAFLA